MPALKKRNGGNQMNREMTNLYNYAENNHIDVDYFPMEATKSLSIRGAVALNPKMIKSESETIICLAHELGHQATNSFYKIKSKFETRERMEEQAKRWAAARLVPLSDLKIALKNGITEIWELAEHFNVTTDFMEDVIRIYKLQEKI